MSDSRRHEDWFRKAAKDLHAAKILFAYEGDYSIVCFHCQQVIEKALKGFILQHRQYLVEGHSLVYLCKKAAAVEPSLRDYMKDCAFVNQFYVETRYPADIPMDVDEDEAKDCIEMADRLLDVILKYEADEK